MYMLKIDKQNGNTSKDSTQCGIYCISNTNYFYIGLSNNIKSRWNNHRSKLRRGVHDNYIMQQVYNKYNITGPFKYEIVCLCESKDLATLEIKVHEDYCKKYSDKISMNIANCGSTCNWTDAMREKVSKSHKGLKFSETHKKAISEGQKGCVRKKQRIPIVQLDLEGNLIKVWDSITTVRKELKINVQLSRKSSGGFQWQKYEEWKVNPKGILTYKTSATPIYQYSLENKFIRKFESVQEASDTLNIQACNISSAINGGQKTAGGFIWKH